MTIDETAVQVFCAMVQGREIKKAESVVGLDWTFQPDDAWALTHMDQAIDLAESFHTKLKERKAERTA